MESSAAVEVEKLLTGDLSSAQVVYGLPHDALEDEFFGVHLVLQAAAVTRVLYGMLSDNISGDDAQLWASFVRRGFAASADQGPIRPLRIDYEEKHEDAIVEAIARLDEIGDLIDGNIGRSEIADLIDGLLATS